MADAEKVKSPLREQDLLTDASIAAEFPELQPLVDVIRAAFKAKGVDLDSIDSQGQPGDVRAYGAWGTLPCNPLCSDCITNCTECTAHSGQVDPSCGACAACITRCTTCVVSE